MRVLLVKNYGPDHMHSMNAYADAIADGLKARGVDARTISAPPRLFKGESSKGGVGKWLGYLDKYVLFRPTLKRAAREADLVHVCDQGNAMLIPALRGFRNLITCHDVIAILAAQGEDPSVRIGPTGRLFQSLNLAGLRRAKDVACISETTREQLQSLVHRPADRTHLVPNGLIDAFPALAGERAEAVLAARGISPGTRFLLNFGHDLPYKNRPGVIRIFSKVKEHTGTEGLRLVLSGRELNADSRAVLDASSAKQSIDLLPDVDLETKTALYMKATALLFPSLTEGFGLPIIEAQTLGCPVVTTDRGPMNEIAGEGAILIRPEDEDEAARRIVEALPRLDEVAARGLKNAERYTQAAMVDNFLGLYREILGRSG